MWQGQGVALSFLFSGDHVTGHYALVKETPMRSYIKNRFIICLFLFMVAGCGGGGGGDGSPDPENGGNTDITIPDGGSDTGIGGGTVGAAGAATIGIAGGTISTADNKVSFALVPRAVLSDTEITMTPLDSYPTDSRVIPGTVYEFGPDGILFNGRVELTLAYDPLSLPEGVNEDDLVIGKLINGAWQPVFGSMVDRDNNRVSVPIRGFSTYGVMNGKRVNSVVAYVVASPATANEFGELGSAADYVCQNLQPGQRGGIVIRKTPVSAGTLNLSCDIEIKADDNTTPAFDGGGTINTFAPVSFVGFQFAGSTTFNTGDDLTLIKNTFGELNLNPGTASAPALASSLNKSVSRAPAIGCFDGNTLVKENTVAGTLTLGGGARVCGDTYLQRGDITALVADGTMEFALQAKLELNGSLVKSIMAEAKFSGSASTTIASIQGNDVSTVKMHLLDGDITLNQLNHEVSGTVTVDTDGVADLTVNQKGLTVGGNYDLKTAGMGLDTKTFYNATMDVTGDATVEVGGIMEGKYKDTTFAGKFTGILGLNARQLGLDQAGVTFGGEVRHNLLTDQAEQRLDLTIKGNASTTYEKGVGTCISTGASARVEYTDSIVKNLVGSIGAGLIMVGKTSCDGQLFKAPRVTTRTSAKTTALAPASGDADEIIIRNMTNPVQDSLVGIDIRDVDIPVTIENNQVKAMLLGIRVKNVSKKVLINNNTIDADGGVELADLPDATFSNNRQSDNTGLVIDADPDYGAVITRIAVTGNTFGAEGVILGGPYGTSIITATGNTLYGAEIAPGSYMGLSGNTFTGTGGSISDNGGGGFFIDPGHGVNAGLDDENDIETNVDWTGNGCADYPPSNDSRGEDGMCLGDEGVPPPVLPLS